MNLANEQLEILQHTAARAPGGLYCGGGTTMGQLVELGLMAPAGRKGFVPDEYFRLTEKGKQVLREQEERKQEVEWGAWYTEQLTEGPLPQVPDGEHDLVEEVRLPDGWRAYRYGRYC